jgi:hypothetical protein
MEWNEWMDGKQQVRGEEVSRIVITVRLGRAVLNLQYVVKCCIDAL